MNLKFLLEKDREKNNYEDNMIVIILSYVCFESIFESELCNAELCLCY